MTGKELEAGLRRIPVVEGVRYMAAELLTLAASGLSVVSMPAGSAKTSIRTVISCKIMARRPKKTSTTTTRKTPTPTAKKTPTLITMNPNPDNEEPEVNRDGKKQSSDLGVAECCDVPSLFLGGTF